MRALAVLAFLAMGCRAAEPADVEEEPAVAAPAAPVESGLIARQRPFAAVEYASYLVEGTGAITGQAFLRTRGGEVKFGAGAVVVLEPVTNYSREWFEREVVGGAPLARPDSRAQRFRRTTRADGFGGFTFSGLAAGEYYVACEIRWEIHDGHGGFLPAGGWAYAIVEVSEGRETHAVVTR